MPKRKIECSDIMYCNRKKITGAAIKFSKGNVEEKVSKVWRVEI